MTDQLFSESALMHSRTTHMMFAHVTMYDAEATLLFS